jgi:hypothetical protein
MGAFLDQISFKLAKPRDVAEVIGQRLPARRCFVTLTDRKWVTVFPEPSEEDFQEPGILAMGKKVCSACRCRAFAFRVVDSDIFYWWVFDEAGQVVGQSCPSDRTEDLSDDEQMGLAGDLSQIAALGSDRRLTAERIRQDLSIGRIGALELSAFGLQETLGIEYANLTYEDVVRVVHSPPLLALKGESPYDWTKEFIFVGDQVP